MLQNQLSMIFTTLHMHDTLYHTIYKNPSVHAHRAPTVRLLCAHCVPIVRENLFLLYIHTGAEREPSNARLPEVSEYHFILQTEMVEIII